MVTVPGLGGELGILPGHTPLISQLQTGVLTYVQDGKSFSLHVSGGFVEVRDDHVSVLAEVAERPDEIDVAGARASRDKLEKQLNAWSGSEEDFEEVKTELDRSVVRLQLAARG
jgi:F-type H+-transporting ATPase subunit epsilon